MLTRETVIWVARETTLGTDPAMTSANGLLAYDVDIDIKGEVLERPVLRDTLSPIAGVIGMKEVALTFKTELKGAGLTGTVPAIPEVGVPLSGCGFDTGVYSGTSLIYSLVSSEDLINSLAFKVFLGSKNIHKILDAKGTVKFNMNAGQYGVAEWSFQGLYNAIISGTSPSLAGLGTTLPPIVYNSGFQIGGFSPVCSTAEIDLANDVIRRDSLNATYGVHSFRITGRKPMMTFNADAVAESSNPFWGDWSGDVLATFGIQIGTTFGNVLKMGGFFKYETNKYGDQDGVRKYDCSAQLVSSTVNTSNDELTLTFL